MKRSASLQSLSHDHYAGLQLAARIRRLCASPADVSSIVADVAAFREAELRPHFAAESTLLLPLLEQIAPTFASRMVDEHATLNSLVDRLIAAAGNTRDLLVDFATLLSAHIRFEERQAFPAIEQEADEETLRSIQRRLEALS